MDLSGEPVFAPGLPPAERRRRRRPVRPPLSLRQPVAPDADQQSPYPIFFPQTWEERSLTLAAPGHIRLFDPPPTSGSISIAQLWFRDKTLTEWHTLMDEIAAESPMCRAMRPANYEEDVRAIFYTNQRKRWLARVVLQRWQQRVWRRRTQCNVDLIDMQPIPDRDAVFLTDVATRTVYRFHRRDLFSNLLSNICLADEMLPSPRAPTNPYTNAPLTLTQTISVCQQLVQDYARRGRCPPVLFSAFCAARYNLARFERENASLLAQHAVTAYFKDIHDDNRDAICDTMFQLLTDNHLSFSPVAVRRWLRASPPTPLHREWLEMVRDYTMYINLHVQIRPHWYNQDMIDRDVQRLYARTTIPEPASRRMTLLRTAMGPQLQTQALASTSHDLLGIQIVPVDLSGGEMDYSLALQLIQQALFRL